MTFDDELRRALGREEPPPEFAERTMARISDRPAHTSVAQRAAGARRRPAARWLALAVAASLVVAAGAGRFIVRRRAAQEGEHAKRQVELALRITSEKLNEVRAKVEASSRNQF